MGKSNSYTGLMVEFRRPGGDGSMNFIVKSDADYSEAAMAVRQVVDDDYGDERGCWIGEPEEMDIFEFDNLSEKWKQYLSHPDVSALMDAGACILVCGMDDEELEYIEDKDGFYFDGGTTGFNGDGEAIHFPKPSAILNCKNTKAKTVKKGTSRKKA